MAGLWFRMFRGDRTRFKETMLGVLLLQEIRELRTELPKRPQNSDYFKEKILLVQAQENGVDLDEERLLFLAGGQTNTFDDNVDEGPVQDMAQNKDNIFQADQCDAFDSDVDEAPTTQTMFMANLSSADPDYDEAGPLYHHVYVPVWTGGAAWLVLVVMLVFGGGVVLRGDVDSHDDNIKVYIQRTGGVEVGCVEGNEAQVVQSDASSIPNDAVMMITNDIYEQDA
ncbi:hypothetical protein Tco_1471637 [Tanacetum coccineum]